jgi:hypothetical protein
MSILKREVFYDDTGGYIRFWDWALVTTTLGTMAEPFSPNERRLVGEDIGQYDPTDAMSRMDSIRASSIDTQLLTLSGGRHQLHGGALMPRTGR